MTCKQCTAHRQWRAVLLGDLGRMLSRWRRDGPGGEQCLRELELRVSLAHRPEPRTWQEKLRDKTEEP